MRAAFYKSTRPGVSGLYNRLVRVWERGPHSHVELVFSDGKSASASLIDDGVRFKDINFKHEHWDFIDLAGFDEVYARQWFVDHEHDPYDLWGQSRFIISPVKPSERGVWCSEAVAAALQLCEPWRYGVNPLRAVLASPFLNPASAGFSL